MCRQPRGGRPTPDVGSLLARELLVDHPRLRAHATSHPIRLAVGIPSAINQTEDSVGMPAIVPETHGGSVLRRKAGGWQAIRIHGNVGMQGTGPGGRPALV